MGYIHDSPFKSTLLRIKAEEGGHHTALDDDEINEIETLIPQLEDEEERLYMTLTVFMGLRPEEVFGLQWEDLHLEQNYGQVKRESPWCYSRTQRVKRRAFKHLGISGHTPYDFRTTFATRAKESGQTSAQVADLLGHKDTRMVERIYARTRHQSVMKQLEVIERLNS